VSIEGLLTDPDPVDLALCQLGLTDAYDLGYQQGYTDGEEQS
jgi:hypothetical protein